MANPSLTAMLAPALSPVKRLAYANLRKGLLTANVWHDCHRTPAQLPSVTFRQDAFTSG